MDSHNSTGNYYTIRHVAQFSGLTDRTIRSYIADGFLQGEKINGLWHFTEEQIDQFLRHPAVRPSIQSKRNALIQSFLLEDSKQQAQCCMILDLPHISKADIVDFFCNEISRLELRDFHFSFDGFNQTPRIILKGRYEEVVDLIDRFQNR